MHERKTEGKIEENEDNRGLNNKKSSKDHFTASLSIYLELVSKIEEHQEEKPSNQEKEGKGRTRKEMEKQKILDQVASAGIFAGNRLHV